MTPIEISLAVLGAVSGVATLHSWYTGLNTGDRLNQILNEARESHLKIERLSGHILYTPSIQQVHTINETSSRVGDLRELREILEPVQMGLNQDILSTAVLTTPSKLRQAFQTDPFEVLIETRPAARVKRPANPDLLPILFHDGGTYYVGWQTSGALPILFNCDYSPDATPETSSPRIRLRRK